MAKEDKAKIKMTVIHFETESDNSTLVENIKAITQTLTRSLSQPLRVVQSRQLLAAEGKSSQGEIEQVEEELALEEEDEAQEVNSNNGAKKSTVTRAFRTPEVLELDLTSGDEPLKAFLMKKNPDVDTKKCVAIAHWLKAKRDLPEITADHVYTCYRHMGWQVPQDASSPLRNIKKSSYGWMKKGKAKGAYAITHIGENEVMQMN